MLSMSLDIKIYVKKTLLSLYALCKDDSIIIDMLFYCHLSWTSTGNWVEIQRDITL